MTTRSQSSLLCAIPYALLASCGPVSQPADAASGDVFRPGDAGGEADARSDVQFSLRSDALPAVDFIEGIVAPVELLHQEVTPDHAPLAMAFSPVSGTCELYRDGDVANQPWLSVLVGSATVSGGFRPPRPGVYPIATWGTPVTATEARVAFNPLSDSESERRLGVSGSVEILSISTEGATVRFDVEFADGSEVSGVGTASPCDVGP